MMVGKMSYPTYRISALLKDVKVLHEKFGKKAITKEHIAQVLGHKPNSGGFAQKIADLKVYKLLDGGRGTFSVSDIGIKATFGTSQERDEALDRAVRSVDLWRLIYEKLGKTPDIDTFWLDLEEITGASRPESQKKADAVRKAYIDDARYLLTVNTPVEVVVPKPADTLTVDSDRSDLMDIPQLNTGTIGYIGFPEYSRAPIEIKDEISLNIAKQLLEAIGERLKKQKSEMANSASAE